MRNRFILGLVLLAVGFLTGFFLEFPKARDLGSRLDQTANELAKCRGDLAVSRFRDLASLSYLEATRKNYGTATEHALKLFQDLDSYLAKAGEPALRPKLEEALAMRGSVLATLNKADAAAVGELQNLVLKLHEAAQP